MCRNLASGFFLTPHLFTVSICRGAKFHSSVSFLLDTSHDPPFPSTAFCHTFSRWSLLARGASFGLGAIVSQVSDEGAFGDQLGRIVPRLYRYRYDPSAKTRQAMEQLWRSIVGGANGGVGGVDFSSREKEVRGARLALSPYLAVPIKL